MARRTGRLHRTRIIRGVVIGLVGVYGFVVYHTTTRGIQSALPPSADRSSEARALEGYSTSNSNTILVKPPSFNVEKRGEDTAQLIAKEPPVLFYNWTNGINEYDETSTEEERLWERSPTIPQWMKDYFLWHRRQRTLYVDTKENEDAATQKWQNARYLILECRIDFNKCGGTADRLGPVPFAISMAAATNRILFIHWETPAPLERFLMPPMGGMDWRVPRWLYRSMEDQDKLRINPRLVPDVQKIPFRSAIGTYDDYLKQLAEDESITVVRAKYQSHNHGATYYNAHRRKSVNDPTFAQVYHDVFRVLFTPSPRVAHRIERYLMDMRLIPGKYSVIHLRALYGVADRDRLIVESWTRNSIKCATNFPREELAVPGEATLAFVSDSAYAVHVAQSLANMTKMPLTARTHEMQALHLEKAEHHPAYAYYDSFVDLYIIGLAKCTVYNMGGFGRLGSLLGRNSTCAHHLSANMSPCSLGPAFQTPKIERMLRPDNPLFLPSMDDYGTESIDAFFKSTEMMPLPQIPASLFEEHTRRTVKNVTPITMPSLYEKHETGAPNMWDRSKTMPSWMKQYFFWHLQMREQLSPSTWKTMKFMVVQCLETDGVCGGTSDRLKPIPALVRIAAITKRVLLIQWERPAPLEEFLLPPKGGLDWRVPSWLGPLVVFEGAWASAGVDIRAAAITNDAVIRCRYQTSDAGAGFYNENLAKGETPFEELYHDVWRTFFTPAPPVAVRIRESMLELGLTPGSYASAHVRALYARESRPLNQIKRWTEQALNCASNMSPGTPIFLASDSSYASEVAAVYGIYRNASIVSHKSDPDPPLHLDKAIPLSGSGKRPVSDYFDTFIDLYLLSFGKCLYYNKGGYGSWAMLIGGTKCSMRSKRTKQGVQNPCDWNGGTSGPSHQPFLSEPLFAEPI